MSCKYCNKKLVSIGHKRQNGANHNDWDDRMYHKKCWKILNSKCDECGCGYIECTCKPCKKCNQLLGEWFINIKMVIV